VLSPSAKTALLRAHLPGNVRELANTIERAVILAEEDVIEASDLGLREAPRLPPPALAPDTGFVLPDKGVVLEEVEKSLVRQALERTGGNKSRAAELLGLTRATLRYRIEKLGLGDPGS
jgi:DNA-binding NtrC family response regulator